MARNDEGEFELVLGNAQLIGVFLIVVILLGVFFAMGYIVGRNTGAPAGTSASKPIVVEHPSVASQGSQEPPASAESKPPVSEPAGTHPEQPASAPAPVTPAPVTTAAPPKEKPSPLPTKSSPSTPARASSEPASGEYWQVVATSRPDAEIVSETLNKKGFHSMIMPAPKEGIFRVVVGPLKNSAAQAQTRSDLEAAGFKNPILRKY